MLCSHILDMAVVSREETGVNDRQPFRNRIIKLERQVPVVQERRNGLLDRRTLVNRLDLQIRGDGEGDVGACCQIVPITPICAVLPLGELLAVLGGRGADRDHAVLDRLHSAGIGVNGLCQCHLIVEDRRAADALSVDEAVRLDACKRPYWCRPWM